MCEVKNGVRSANNGEFYCNEIENLKARRRKQYKYTNSNGDIILMPFLTTLYFLFGENESIDHMKFSV